MLQEGEIKFAFNEEALQVGDILLMNTYHEQQRRLMGNCIYDHAAIYAGDAFLLEADGCGVVQSHIYSYGFREANHACVLRLKDSNPQVLNDMIIGCREQLGKGFSTGEARRTLLYRDTNQEAQSNETFCSRYVATAYHSHGYSLVKNANYCAPDDFLHSDMLNAIADGIQSVAAELLPTILKNQADRENPNTVLQDAFELFSKFYGTPIQSMEELLLASIHHPEQDAEAISLLENNTKLFRAADETVESWPWFNDDEAFFDHFTTVENRLFFLTNQFLHYDNTYLPLFARNCITLSVLKMYFKNAKFLARVYQGFDAVYHEAERVRKRLCYLYIETSKRDVEAFDEFSRNYGFYHNHEFHQPVTDIGYIIQAAMQFGFPSIDINT